MDIVGFSHARLWHWTMEPRDDETRIAELGDVIVGDVLIRANITWLAEEVIRRLIGDLGARFRLRLDATSNDHSINVYLRPSLVLLEDIRQPGRRLQAEWFEMTLRRFA